MECSASNHESTLRLAGKKIRDVENLNDTCFVCSTVLSATTVWSNSALQYDSSWSGWSSSFLYATELGLQFEVVRTSRIRGIIRYAEKVGSR